MALALAPEDDEACAVISLVASDTVERVSPSGIAHAQSVEEPVGIAGGNVRAPACGHHFRCLHVYDFPVWRGSCSFSHVVIISYLSGCSLSPGVRGAVSRSSACSRVRCPLGRTTISTGKLMPLASSGSPTVAMKRKASWCCSLASSS